MWIVPIKSIITATMHRATDVMHRVRDWGCRDESLLEKEME